MAKSVSVQILNRFGLMSCKPVSTPMDMRMDFSNEERENRCYTLSRYQELIDCLLYISTKTRADISAAVGILCRSLKNPTELHCLALKRVSRYLCGTVTYSIRLGTQKRPLLAYCDSDWAGDISDRKSTTGYCLMLGNSMAMWRTIKQECTALSTTEACSAMTRSGKTHKATARMFGGSKETRRPRKG